MTKELTEPDFKSTFGTNLTDVTKAVVSSVNIWPYVEDLVRQNIVDRYMFDKNSVELVYRNDTSTFDHILLPTGNQNVFIVIIVDLKKENVYGHYTLNLENEYSLK